MAKKKDKEYIQNYILRTWIRLLLLITILLFFHTAAFSASDDEEIVLSFSHPAVGQYYINAIYSDNTVYLPAMELFNLLYVHYEKGSSGHSLQGSWQRNDNTWQINTNTLQATIGKEQFALTTKDFRIGELDLYLSPALLERIFGLRFTINMNALSVSLEYDKTLPVEEKKQHEELRRQLERQKANEKDFPLLYPRNRKVIGAGMVDYSLMLNADKGGTSGAYTVTGGMELLGGDAQGTVYGDIGNTAGPLKTTNLNWRYVLGENPILTSFRAGQISTTGLQTQRIVGGAISNDPIEPRKIYNTYSIDGNTTPDSQVELYINNQLTDYTRADELGYYRFNFSLTYGTVRISLRIYTPSGEIINEERQMQIPFTFLPKGVVSYNMQGGAIDDGMSDIRFDKYAMHGDVAWGLTNTLTAKAGADYMSYNLKPLYYGSLSARLFGQYLLNIDAAPDAFYKTTASVTYASSRSFSLVYTKFENDSLYNPRRAKQEFDANIYLPFNMFGLPSGFRLGGEHYLLENSRLSNYNLDFNSRLGRFNVRANYRDQLTTTNGKAYFSNGLATGAVTYTFSRTPGVPIFMKGMFLRAQTQYDLSNKKINLVGGQFSRTIGRRGRLNVNVDHDLIANATRVQAGFTLDLDALRSTTQYTGSGDSYNIQQTFSGSLGLDARSAKLSATNREQVGRAAVSVLMFIDKNGNRKYDDGEEKVPARALRLSESATFELGKDSILRITQLQSYWKYNAEIVQTALPNPTLAPLMSEFSFVADPNRYKRIEIPLYRTGVIEGKVNLRKGGIDAGQGGLRLLLKGVGHSFEETIHTFSDGGYYAMNLLPDKYTIEVDPTQLTFLNATSQPKQLEFEVKALAGGDYVEGLALLLIPKDTPSGTTPEFNRQKTEPAQPLVQQNETVPLNLWVQGKELKTDLLERVSGSCYYVQGGAFYTKPWADKFAAMLATKIPYPMVIMFEDKMYHVRFGYFKSRKAAKQCLEMVKKISPQSFLTFSNFGYYIMNLQPGRYSLEYDPAKLNFLSESSKPGRLEFEVKALTKGDYVNGSTLLLKPKDIQTGVSVPVTTPAVNPIKTEPVQPPVKQNMPAKQDESVKQNAKSKQNATSQQDIQVKQHVSVNQNIQRKEDIAVQQKAPVKQNISALHNVTIQGKEQETDSIGRLPGSYYVQGGAFYTKPWADKFAAMLATKIPYPVWVIFENRMYHVKFGYFSNKKTAKQCLEMVKKISPQSFLIMKDR